jgi:phosphoribosylaminoimidazolecarboxamide formyltransferase/IMP cyclohydrolase
MKAIQRALVSVWHKDGVVPFAEALRQYGIEIVSTGGTAALLTQHDVPVTSVETLTGVPAMLGGRVKTLHPRLFGGILAGRNDATHMAEVQQYDLPLIDLVVVDLYPFEEVIQAGSVALDVALEHIDVGGVAMLRAAAKNFADMTVICDPRQYAMVLAELRQYGGATSQALRQRLALEAFQRTAAYDGAISAYLQGIGGEQVAEAAFAEHQTITLRKLHTLRYGENPHQRAALYQSFLAPGPSLVTARQLHGRDLSFNNLADADAALAAVQEFQEPAVVILKHQTPCGVAVGQTLVEAYERAYATDPDAASGGVISCNREVDAALAEAIGDHFLEVLIAPAFHAQALAHLTRRRNRILLALQPEGSRAGVPTPTLRLQWRSIAGGALVQEVDRGRITATALQVVTERQPSQAEVQAMLFAWKVVKHVKSNAIVLVRDGQTVGIGAGQMSRVDASRMAVLKARSSTVGCVAASDAFFPFRDGLDEVAQAGVRAVIQPGGSVRDPEVIAAANEHGLAMVFTGLRAFKH